jgi:glutathione reductase (NADPH)
MTQDTPQEFDLVVLGAGSGGLAAAKRAATHGAKVAIVENHRIGGTCVIRGCVPKKLMVYASGLAAARRLACDFGFAAAPESFSWEHLVRVRNQVVANLELSHSQNLAKAGVTAFAATARLTGPHTVHLQLLARPTRESPVPVQAPGTGAEKVLRAKHILIATGSTPIAPDIAGAQLGMSSDGFFELKALPHRAVLVGGGYIAVEFACLLAGLGCETTLVVRSSLLREFDRDISDSLLQALRTRGIKVLEHTELRRLDRGDAGHGDVAQGDVAHDSAAYGKASQGNAPQEDSTLGDTPQSDTARGLTAHSGALTLTVAQRHKGAAPDAAPHEQRLHSDACVLFAIGRRPNTDGLGLQELGIRLGKTGAIEVNALQQTAVPHIAALGDVIDRVNLTPVAIKAGRAYADRTFGRLNPAAVPYDLVPTAVFSEPPIGVVGLTEVQAHEKFGEQDVQVFKSRFIPLRYAASPPARKVAAMVKVVVHRPSDAVLGIHILGDDAPEIIQGFAVALTAGVTKAMLDQTLALHPSLAEELVLLR